MKKKQLNQKLKLALTLGLALPFIPGLSATSFAAHESGQPCNYTLILDRLVTEKKLPENEQLSVNIGVPSNKAHDFFAIRAVTLKTSQDTPAGSTLEFDSQSERKVEIDLDQVDALKSLESGAILGLQINVTRKSNFLQTFFADAATGFLSVGSENFLLQETDYSPASSLTSSHSESQGFDPRQLSYERSTNTSSFKISNDNVSLLMKVTRGPGQCGL